MIYADLAFENHFADCEIPDGFTGAYCQGTLHKVEGDVYFKFRSGCFRLGTIERFRSEWIPRIRGYMELRQNFRDTLRSMISIEKEIKRRRGIMSVLRSRQFQFLWNNRNHITISEAV